MADEGLSRLSSLLDSGELPGRDKPDRVREADKGMGLGLAATNRRLRLCYGPQSGLRVSHGKGGRGFRVELRVPFQREAS